MKFTAVTLGVRLLTSLLAVQSHPLCLDDSAPNDANQAALTFCTAIKDPAANSNGACCNANREMELKATLYDPYVLSPDCALLHAQVACGECNPYAVHLYATGSGIMLLCKNFCRSYFAACKTDLSLPDDYCEVNSTSDFYCYPIDDSLDTTTTLTPYFENLWDELPEMPIGMFMKPGSNVWWYIDQNGYIIEIENDPSTTEKVTVLTIDQNVLTNGEMGLVGFTFSPDYETTKRFYVNYIDNGQNTIISRFTDKGDPNQTLGTEQRLMQFHQPYANHNGGTLLFAPYDYLTPTGQEYYDLYITVGDGGSANNPDDSAQNIDSPFGKILRIRIPTDINRQDYTIPEDNLRNTVWAYGLRNPWKCTFDRDMVDKPQMWCGDVGQDYVEEINIIKPGGNHGWRNYEGTRYNELGDEKLVYIPPIYEYCHNNDPLPQCIGKTFVGQSVTGGYVYRGKRQADQYGGNYIFADYQQGSIHRIYQVSEGVYAGEKIAETGFHISSLAEDNDGELYIMKYGGIGMAYRLPDLQPGQVPAIPYTPPPTATPPTLPPTVFVSPAPTEVKLEVPEMKCSAEGVQNGNICCALSCGDCDGEGSECSWYNGGAARCCTHIIAQSNIYCSATQSPPCILVSPSDDFQSLIADIQSP